MKNTTVTLPLEEFDKLRETSKKYSELYGGIDGFMGWLVAQKSETENPYDRIRLYIQRYNETNPKQRFHL